MNICFQEIVILANIAINVNMVLASVFNGTNIHTDAPFFPADTGTSAIVQNQNMLREKVRRERNQIIIIAFPFSKKRCQSACLFLIPKREKKMDKRSSDVEKQGTFVL